MIGNTAVSVGGIVWVGRRAGRPFPGECGELQFDAAFAGNGLFRTEGHAPAPEWLHPSVPAERVRGALCKTSFFHPLASKEFSISRGRG